MSKEKVTLKDSQEKYPGNSNEKKKKRKKVEKGKVITKNAKKRKKTLMQKFVSNFVGEDIDNVGSYIVQDILIPTAKTTIIDMVNGGLEMLFHGESGGHRSSRRGRFGKKSSYVSYNSATKRNKRSSRSNISRLAHNFDDIVFTSKEEAQRVLDYLVDMTIDMGEATVGDFYRAVGIKASHTDENFGWTRLNTARIRRSTGKDGVVYTIAFPRTEEL